MGHAINCAEGSNYFQPEHPSDRSPGTGRQGKIIMKITTTGKPGTAVSDSLFGGNALFHIDHDVPVFEQKAESLGVSNLRWPGGSITEGWFDPTNPDTPLRIPRPDERPINHDNIMSFTDVMTLAKSSGRAVDIVLPTQHVLKPADAQGNRSIDKVAVAEITDFVKRALQSGGEYPDAKIASFEVGNEYWSAMTAKEYGQIANVLIKAIQEGIDASGVKDQPKVLVQVGDGWGPEFRPGGEYYGQGLSWGQEVERANQDLIDQLDADARSMIDGLIEHFYPRNRGEMSFDTVEAWSAQKKQSVWAANGMKLDLHVTEWNLNSHGLKEDQDAFASGSGMLETFEYLVRMGVQSAHVWPITQNTSSDLTGKVGGGADHLSSNGAVFSLLSRNVRGLAWQKLDIEDVPTIESSFYTGSDKAVLFLTADDDAALDATLDLSALAPKSTLKNGYLQVTQFQVVRDSSHDQWVGGGAGAQIIAGPQGYDTAVSVSLKPYEIVMVKLEWMPPKIIGAQSASVVTGSAIPEDIRGGPAAQLIRALGGSDVVHGGAGDDSIWGGNGNDTLFGGTHDDMLWSEAGNDFLYGEAGADILHGGTGNDLLSGGAGDDRLNGDDGDDSLVAGDGNDVIAGGAGNDRLWGGAGNDALNGGAGNDTHRSEAGDDVVIDDLGADTVYGGWGNDRISVGTGNDLVIGGDGNDILNGGLGDDSLCGDNGNDILVSGVGDDYLRGGAGHDALDGGAGNDVIISGGGNDLVQGGAGNDLFYFGTTSAAEGGAGSDRVWGGAGADQFLFSGTSGFTDIMGFEDRIDRIRFPGRDVDGFKDISMRENGHGDVVISWSGGQIRLQDISLSQLSAADFIF